MSFAAPQEERPFFPPDSGEVTPCSSLRARLALRHVLFYETQLGRFDERDDQLKT